MLSCGSAKGRDKKEEAAISEALRMVDIFASVGADRFDITQTNINEDMTAFRPGQTPEQARRNVPEWIRQAACRHGIELRPSEPGGVGEKIQAGQNLIVRPYGTRAQLVQLDDLDQAALERVRPAAFLILRTSPSTKGSQSWVAVEDGDGREFASKLRRDTGADLTASGATRVAGSENVKPKYRAGDAARPEFPIVAITEATPGRTVTKAQLEALGLVAAVEPKQAAAANAAPRAISLPRSNGRWRGGKKWPDYGSFLTGAPPNGDGSGPDRSRADFLWSKVALRRRFSFDQVEEQLLKVSEKARERKNSGYARDTVRSALDALEREAGPQR